MYEHRQVADDFPWNEDIGGSSALPAYFGVHEVHVEIIRGDETGAGAHVGGFSFSGCSLDLEFFGSKSNDLRPR